MNWIYSSPHIYEGLLRIIYGKAFEERYEAVSALIPENASVLDVCAGDCRIYRRYLKKKGVNYLAVDDSEAFEASARRSGVPFTRMDIHKRGPLPESDYVMMMGSLYIFLPGAQSMAEHLKGAARKALIICEPVRNLAQSRNKLVRFFARKLTYPYQERLDESSLENIFRELKFSEWRLTPSGREIIGIYRRAESPAKTE